MQVCERAGEHDSGREGGKGRDKWTENSKVREGGWKRASHVAGNNSLTLVQQRECSSQAGGAEKFSDAETKVCAL